MHSAARGASRRSPIDTFFHMPSHRLARRPFTIRQWSALLVAVCVLPAILAVSTLLYLSYRRERVNTENLGIGITRALMQAIDRELSIATGMLEALSISPYLDDANLGAFHRQASQLANDSPNSSFILFDRDGKQLINTLVPYGTALPADYTSKEVLDVVTTRHGDVSDLYVDAVENRYFVKVIVPIRRNDRYVLAMQFRPDRLEEILARQRIPEQWVAAVLDSKGIVVARTRESTRFIGMPATPGMLNAIARLPEGALEDHTLEGIPSIAFFSRSSVSSWTVVIGVHRTHFMQPLIDSIVWIAALFFGLFAAGTGLAIIIAERISRPVRSLAAHAVALGHGRAVIAEETTLREADEVAHAMEEASVQLKQRTAERDRAAAEKHKLLESKRKSEQNEAFLDGVFQGSPDAVLLIERDGSIIRTSSEARRMFAIEDARAGTLRIEDILPSGHFEEQPRLCESLFLQTGKHAVMPGRQIMARRSDGHRFPVDVMASPMHLTDRDMAIVTIRDVTERVMNEEALRQSEARFRSALEHAPIGMAIVSLDGHWLEVNNSACEMLGYSRDELKSLTFQDVSYAPDLALDLDYAQRLLRGEIRSYQMEKRYVRKDGAIVPALLTGSVVMDENGAPVHFIAQMLDISERKRSEEERKILTDRIALATRAGRIAVWDWNLRTGFLTWDERMWELYGFPPRSRECKYELWRSGVHPEDVERVETEIKAAVEGRGEFSSEFRIVRPDDEVRYVHADALITTGQDGAPEKMTGINMDVTENRKRELAISIALQEKEMLLKELYHRVKNNLQMIASMFNLQVRVLPEGAARLALTEAAGRVGAISLVHEKLYQSGNLSSIALDSYVKELCEHLAQLGFSSHSQVVIKVDVEPLQIGIETAIPLGVILNELISNCFKHAFPDGRQGQILVRVHSAGSNRVFLSVEDNGKGLPQGFDLASCQGLGLRLVAALTRQLRGSFSVLDCHGACATLEFSLADLTAKAESALEGIST